MTGTVYQSTGKWYSVKLENGKLVQCRLKGKLRLDNVDTTNPVAVGDKVDIEMDNNDHTIAAIQKRENYIIRSSPRHAHKNHIIASNIEQSLLIVSMRSPRTRLGFIDRFLVLCEMYHVPAKLIFNKKDLYRDKDFKTYETLKELYEGLGYPTFLASIEDEDSIETVRNLLKDKNTLVSGQSGVGKSSILNKIEPELDIKTKVISNYNEKGQHTTTYATMYDLTFGGQVIDTPGIKMLSLINLEPEEVSHYFPEMIQLINQCKFDNCSHLSEPGCKVTDAYEQGLIAESRFTTYVNVYQEVKDTNYWQR